MMGWIGPLTIVLGWVAVAYLLYHWRHLGVASISEHGAGDRRSYRLFAVTASISAVLISNWLVTWVAPRLGLGSAFIATTIITLVTMLITAVVPDSFGWRRHLHRTAAYAMAVLFGVEALFIVVSPDISQTARAVCLALTTYMYASFTFVIVLRMFRNHFLLLQGLYILAFELLLLVSVAL